MNLIESLWERIAGDEGRNIPLGELREDALVLADAYLDIADEARANLVRILADAMIVDGREYNKLMGDIEDSPSYQRCFRRACRRAKTTEKKSSFAETISAFREYVEILPTIIRNRNVEISSGKEEYTLFEEYTIFKEGKYYYLTFDRRDRYGQLGTFEARIAKRMLKFALAAMDATSKELRDFVESLPAKRL